MNKLDTEIKQVPITIYASVSSEVTLAENETLEDVKGRLVDIYLHNAGDEGFDNKVDLGADCSRIATQPEDEMVLVNKGFFLALIDTAKRETFLEAVYDDTRKTDYDWVTLGDLVSGMSPEEIQSLIPTLP